LPDAKKGLTRASLPHATWSNGDRCSTAAFSPLLNRCRTGQRAKQVLTACAICLLCLLCLPALMFTARAQAPSDSSQMAPEPSIQAKIAQLKAAKEGLAREARETMGYHQSLRQMKIVKIDGLIARLKRGENVPQSKIDHTIGHSSIPLYKAPSS
jgi:hypothetical protein